MSRFSAEPWRLMLDGYGWRLSRDRTEFAVRVEPAACAADALQALDEGKYVRGGELSVELRDNHLRYLVADWPDRVGRRRERAAWSEERLRDLYGLDATQWVVALDRNPKGGFILGCAAPRSLVDAVSAFAATRRMRITAMRGNFVTTCNYLRKDFDEAMGGLAVHNGNHLTMGVWRLGYWRRVLGVPVTDGVEQTLQRTLASWLPEIAAAGPVSFPTLHVVGIEPCMLPAGWQCRMVEVLS